MVNTATFEKAVQAAVKGPEAKKIKFGSHEFNVKPVSISATRAGGKRVKGQISHCLATTNSASSPAKRSRSTRSRSASTGRS
jgi:hypothetical protein